MAAQDPRLAEEIFPRILKRTPDEQRAYHLYLQHLEKVGDWERRATILSEARSRFGEAEFPDRWQ